MDKNPCLDMLPPRLADYGPAGHRFQRDYPLGEAPPPPAVRPLRVMDVLGGDLERDGSDYRYGPSPFLGIFFLALLGGAVAAAGVGVVWLSRAAQAVGPYEGLVCP